ncbi:MAG: polysaccharide deacetylase family protein [Candidatus Omnitrophota bacterium]
MADLFLPVLMYHRISKNKGAENYTVSSEDFYKQMQYLHEQGFKSLTTDDIPDLGEGEYKKIIMITFDDGCVTDYTEAYPILKKYGFKATFFVNTDQVAKDGYMDWGQILELQREGNKIESHTHTHPNYISLLKEDMIRGELAISKKTIEGKLNTPAVSLSLPGGDYSRKIKKIADEVGYEYVFVSKPGRNPLSLKRRNVFSRIAIMQRTSLERFRGIVNNDSFISNLNTVNYYLKLIAKKIIGARRYYHLWNKYFKLRGKK